MSLVVGVPTETKVDEFRVAVTPEGVRELEMHGIEVLVQAGAGAGSGLPDEVYRAAGAEIVADPAEIWERSQIVCKVKEPSAHEFAWFRDDLTLVTFLHLAPTPRWPTPCSSTARPASPTRPCSSTTGPCPCSPP